MNLRYTCYVILFSLIVNHSYGQDTVLAKSTKSQFPSWTIKLPLLNLLDPNSPNLQVGVERQLNRHIGLQFTAGVSVDPNRSVVNGFRLKGEYRHYFGIKKRHSFFWGGDVFYTRYSSRVAETFVNGIDSSLYEDHFTIYKKMYGANAKFGFHKECKNHFMFEVYSGLGFKVRSVTQQGRTNPSDSPESVVDINLAAISYEAGQATTISMPLNFAIGYMFR